MYTTKRIMSKDCPHVTAKWSQDTSSKIWEYIAAMIKVKWLSVEVRSTSDAQYLLPNNVPLKWSYFNGPNVLV